jgi:hypothetical protein
MRNLQRWGLKYWFYNWQVTPHSLLTALNIYNSQHSTHNTQLTTLNSQHSTHNTQIKSQHWTHNTYSACCFFYEGGREEYPEKTLACGYLGINNKLTYLHCLSWESSPGLHWWEVSILPHAEVHEHDVTVNTIVAIIMVVSTLAELEHI